MSGGGPLGTSATRREMQGVERVEPGKSVAGTAQGKWCLSVVTTNREPDVGKSLPVPNKNAARLKSAAITDGGNSRALGATGM